MQNLFTKPVPPLPETLAEDLEELLRWDNNCFLTWISISTDDDPTGSRWFTVSLGSDGRQFGFSLEFWIPEWMGERGVAAILPAHLDVSACDPGKLAMIHLGMRPWPELKASVPKVARTCARLINELWGRTESDGVLLLTIDYQPERLATSFPEILANREEGP